MIFKTWVWFYARAKLGLTIGDTGIAISWGMLLQVAVSYPAGWLIDRFGSYIALSIERALMLTLTIFSAQVTNFHGLVVLTLLTFFSCLYRAQEIRSCGRPWTRPTPVPTRPPSRS